MPLTLIMERDQLLKFLGEKLTMVEINAIIDSQGLVTLSATKETSFSIEVKGDTTGFLRVEISKKPIVHFFSPTEFVPR